MRALIDKLAVLKRMKNEPFAFRHMTHLEKRSTEFRYSTLHGDVAASKGVPVDKSQANLGQRRLAC